MTDAPKTTGCWYRITPNRLVFVLLLALSYLALSDLFSYNDLSPNNLLISLGLSGATVALLAIWYLVNLIFRWRFQLNMASLVLLIVMVAMLGSCLWVKIKPEHDEWIIANDIRKAGGKVWEGRSLLGKFLRNDTLVRIVVVSLRGPAFDDTFIADYIARIRYLGELYLDDTRITDAGLVHLRGLKYLYTLGLRGTKITDAGLENLKGLKYLDILWLDGTEITDAGLERLRGMNKLADLGISGTKVTPKGIEKFRQSFPHCEIWGIGCDQSQNEDPPKVNKGSE